jgi:4-hydroxy 2-oxovalerate aldolase
MKKIHLLDCTLRDGGYINNWNFGQQAIKDIACKIAQTGIEAFEIGFIKDQPYDKNQTIFSSLEDIREMISPKHPNMMYVAMIDMGAVFPVEKIPPYDGTSVDALRIIFKKNKIEEAYTYCKQIQQLGYKTFVQLVSTDTYTDIEFVEVIRKFNEIKPDVLSIVDTFGLIKRKNFLRMLYIADNNLDKEIGLGYHSHNNLQQAFGNAEAMTELNTQRDLYIDACIFGMGRGAGNLNLELFAEYMNETLGKSYRIEPMLEIIDEYLSRIHRESFWGYSLPFYLSATIGCHPNYAGYFAEKGTLTLKSFSEILKLIPIEEKEVYSKETAEKIYLDYQQNYIEDKDTLTQLKKEFSGRKILVIAPGNRLDLHLPEIKDFVKENNPIIISLNFISDTIKADYVFSSNMRRYYKLQHAQGIKKIITSNINDAEEYDYMVNFSSFVSEKPEIVDNSGIMLINLFLSLGIKELFIAGLDGYDANAPRNYVNSGLEYAFSPTMMTLRNKLISEDIKAISKNIKIHFLTKSCYNL